MEYPGRYRISQIVAVLFSLRSNHAWIFKVCTVIEVAVLFSLRSNAIAMFNEVLAEQLLSSFH